LGGSDAGEERPVWVTWTLAVTKFAVGTAMCMVFADPLVGSVADLSRGSGIPGFFIAFVCAPLASNASELVSSLKFARGQRTRNISITFNQVGQGM
jgi:Ca2+/Na+ antiporter